MPNDQPETIAAVLADYRADIPAMTSGELPHPTPEYLRILLDRIEAAEKQEAIDAELKWTRIGYDERKAEEKSAPGNAAAMREELVAFVDSIQWICDGDERGILKKQFAPLLSAARAALAAPARNCDRFATEDEAREAYWAYREPLEFNNKPFVAITEWLFDPAEGGAE